MAWLIYHVTNFVNEQHYSENITTKYHAHDLKRTIFCDIINLQLKMEVVFVAETINVTIRLDREVKENAEKLFNDFGRNLSTAFNIFARQALRQGKIPFEIYDPFYSEKN